MAEPEITTYDRNLPEAFVGAGDLAVHVARICVLFEDLRLESSAARHTEPIELLDTTGKKSRSFYFLRRMILSLDEFSSAAQQINKSPEWKAIRETFDLESKKRWDCGEVHHEASLGMERLEGSHRGSFQGVCREVCDRQPARDVYRQDRDRCPSRREDRRDPFPFCGGDRGECPEARTRSRPTLGRRTEPLSERAVRDRVEGAERGREYRPHHSGRLRGSAVSPGMTDQAQAWLRTHYHQLTRPNARATMQL